MSLKSQLIKTREIVEAGWIKFNYYDVHRCSFCLVGAAHVAAEDRGHPPGLGPQDSQLLKAIVPHLPPEFRCERDSWTRPCLDFNDAPTTTQKDVLDVLDKAIAAADS